MLFPNNLQSNDIEYMYIWGNLKSLSRGLNYQVFFNKDSNVSVKLHLLTMERGGGKYLSVTTNLQPDQESFFIKRARSRTGYGKA